MRDHPPFVAVHCGAPFTGAEDVSRFLSHNRARLEGAGIGVLHADGLAEAPATLPWPPVDGKVAEIADAAGAMTDVLRPVAEGSPDAMILSVPDLPGTPDDLMAGKFFPSVGARAAALRLALGRPVDRIVLVVRPYEQLFRAAWRAAAAEGTAPEFTVCARRMLGFTTGWPEVAEALAEVLGTGDISVLAAPVRPEDVLAELLPEVEVAGLAPVPVTPELTDTALAMIRRHQAQGLKLANGQKERLIAFHARQPQDEDLAPPFPELALADLRGRYIADLATLAATPGVSLSPEAMGFAMAPPASMRRSAY